MRWIRIKALIIKEFLALLRDPKGRAVLIGPPIIQFVRLRLRGDAGSDERGHHGAEPGCRGWGQKLLHRIEGAPTFRTV